MLSGVLGFLSYPSFLTDTPGEPTGWFALPGLTFVSMIPLWVAAWRTPVPKRRFRLGWVTGFVHIALMQGWISGTLVSMSHFPEWGGVLGMLVYAAWAGLPWALLTLIGRPLHERLGPSGGLFATAVVAVLIERFSPVLFPFHLANALFSVPILLQAADLIGIAGVSLLVQGVQLTLAAAVLDRLDGRPFRMGPPALLALVWAAAIGYGVLRVAQIEEAPVRVHVDTLVVQPNVTVEQKNASDPKVREGVYAATVQQTRAALLASRAPPDLLVWPEGGFPFTYQAVLAAAKPTRAERYSEKLRRFAWALGFDFITGSIAAAEIDRASNSALFFKSGTQDVTRYDKRELLLFGERVPFADTFPALRDAIPGMSHHVPGTQFVAWTAGGARVALTICYEAIFAAFTREAAVAADADVLLNLTNDVWFGHTPAPLLHAMLQQARAIELRRWLVRSTNSGVTMLIDPTGRIVARTSLDTAAVLRHTLAVPDIAPSVYTTVGDLFLWLATALAAGLFARREWRFRNMRTQKAE